MSTTSNYSVNKSIRTQLLSLQNSFFQSLRGGTDTLAAFAQEMMNFNEALSCCAQDLEEETRLLISSFVQTSDAVIPTVIDVYISSDKMTSELSEVLAELSLDETTSPEPAIYPTYIQPAHAWLLQNLHNPYPSKQTRMVFSRQTNTSQKDIDSWFTDVRKRIGWNSLRKKHFSSRKEMIAAATKFFKPSSTQLGPRMEIDQTAHFDQEFALLEDNAKSLYSRKFSTSTLANTLDAEKGVAPKANPAGQGASLARLMSSREIETIPYTAYLSPDVTPSPSTFSSPSPPPSPSWPASQDRKRRQSTSDCDPSIEARPLKRTRVDVDFQTRSPLPLTQRSTAQISPTLLDSSSSTTTNLFSISESSRKRKRQSSDSDSEDDQGRLKRMQCIPPSPSVDFMEPLPSGPSNLVDLDHWINSLCVEGTDLGHSIPEPVYETSPLSAPLEIDFYRYASSSPSTSVSSLGPSTPPDYNSSDSPAASHQSWLKSPSLTKAQGYDNLADVTSEFLSANWSEESLLFDLNSPGILDADFPFQNWELGSTPATTSNSISKVVDELTQPWTNEEAVPISVPSNQLSPLTSFSDNTSLPQVFQHSSLDKKGAKIRYLQTLLNEVQNVRLDLAL